MLKENFNKIKALISSKNKASSIGMIIGIIAIVCLVVLLSGALVIFLLNLMGLDLDYTFKTCIGAGLLIFAIRPTSSKE
jgi:hypothetical protein